MTKRARGSKGQATVELALTFPFVVLLLLLVVQLGIVVHAQVLAIHAAREGARAAAVAPVPERAATGAARRSTGLVASRLDVDTTATKEFVVVRARLRTPTDVPIIGALLPDLVLESTVTMQREAP
ncbi:MAG: TadE/TadG family type IV pilus assembly protein [Acidimicrobiales bacterium]